MASYVNCPSCQTKLSLPEGPATRIKCPKCGTKFSVAEATGQDAAPAPRTGATRPVLPQRSASAFDDLASLSESDHDQDPLLPAPALPRRGNAQGAGAAPVRTRGSSAQPANSSVGPIRIGIGVAVLAASIGAMFFVLSDRKAKIDQNNKVLADIENGAQPAPRNEQFRNQVNAGAAPAAAVTPTAAPAVAQASVPAVTPAPAPVQPVLPTATITPPAVVAAPTQERTSEQIVADLKDATVYIKLKVGGKTFSTGTGYAIETQPDGTVLMATNRHVATLDLEEIPPSMIPKDAVPELEVVFRSGQPGQEQVAKAQLAAAYPSDDVETDIAFLVARKVMNPPKPLALNAAIVPTEGQSYIGGGFPLGGLVSKIAQSEGNPSITITKGGISAIRRDDRFGQIKLIQVDGSLQPGNSGGPIVDARTGRFIGMAVAKASSADTIGFLVPADHIRTALAGTVGEPQYVVNSLSTSGADLTIQAELIDPRDQVNTVNVQVAAADSVSKFGPKPDGTWDPLPGATAVPMSSAATPDKKRAVVGRVQAQFQGNSRKVLVQTSHLDTAGKQVYHAPRTLDVPQKPGPILPPNSIQRIVEKMFRKSMEKLSPLIDPEQDCHLSKNDDDGTIKLTIPPKLHVLAPEVRKQKKPVNNAPMSLIDVKGDFMALVGVTGDMNPGAEPLALPEGVSYRDARGQTKRKPPGTFQGAGLLLYQDANNYMRLERASFTQDGRPVLEQKILIEIVKKGEHLIQPIYLPVPESEMMLGISRRNGRISCLIVVGDTLSLGTKQLLLDFPDDVKIGLCASNVSQKPLEAQFKGFVLLDDKAKIEAALGGLEDDKK